MIGSEHGKGRDLTMDDLRNRQSVRATFKLPREVIELLGVIAAQLGIKQKSLLDQLVEDRSILKQLAAQAQEAESAADRQQKTFVLSRSSLSSINAVAAREHVSRDLLVEASIRRLLPLIEAELERHQKRKLIYEEMRDYLSVGEHLRRKARELLGEDDELSQMIDNQVTTGKKHLATVSSIIEKGSVMEEW